MEEKRMHPMKMVFAYITTLRNMLVLFLFFFVIHLFDTSLFYRIGRWALLAYLLWRVLAIFIEWKNTSYAFKGNTIYIKQGLFKRQTSDIPIEKIQNVQRKTPFYYRPFGITFLALETNASGEHATIKLEAISKTEAGRIESRISNPGSADGPETCGESQESHASKKIHYRPSKKDLWKASFLSFSFLALIPVLGTAFKQTDHFFDVDKKAKGFIHSVSNSYLWISLLIGLLIIFAISFGIIRTFLKYSNYEIASDENYIYIRGGMLDERSISVRKSRVQAANILQPPWKRLFGLLEIKLVVSSSDQSDDLGKNEISSLYPYLPENKAWEIMEEILPQFALSNKLHHLSTDALKARMLRLPWFWLAATIVIIIFFNTYWYISLILFILTYARRYFSYRNTRYTFQNSMLQFGMAGLWRKQYITSRKNLVEIETSQSLYQRFFGLATIRVINRANPVHEETLKDVPKQKAVELTAWYKARTLDIRLK